MKTALRIKELRKKLRMTQAEFGELIHHSEASIRRWEHGQEPSAPARRAIERLQAMYLGADDNDHTTTRKR